MLCSRASLGKACMYKKASVLCLVFWRSFWCVLQPVLPRRVINVGELPVMFRVLICPCASTGGSSTMLSIELYPAVEWLLCLTTICVKITSPPTEAADIESLWQFFADSSHNGNDLVRWCCWYTEQVLWLGGEGWWFSEEVRPASGSDRVRWWHWTVVWAVE